MTEKSLYQRRENQKEKFTPQAVTPEKSQEENMTELSWNHCIRRKRSEISERKMNRMENSQ